MKYEEPPEDGGGGEDNTLYAEARDLIISSGHASTSLLQRRLSIGYNRAARIMDELEKEGLVGPARGRKTREGLIRKGQCMTMANRIHLARRL